MKYLNEFINSEKDGIFYIGHAAALVKAGKELILVDGIWNESPYENFIFFPKQIDCSKMLSKVTAAIVSHEHADHWAPEILRKLECPVTVMGNRPRLLDRLADHAKLVIDAPALRWVKLVGDSNKP